MKHTYQRYVTRLRFEPGEGIPQPGDWWDAETVLGGIPKRVRLIRVIRVFEHDKEPGVMLMDAQISTSELR